MERRTKQKQKRLDLGFSNAARDTKMDRDVAAGRYARKVKFVGSDWPTIQQPGSI